MHKKYGLICAHMPVWIRSHLDAVCILRRIRPHQAPEHNLLSKFNANDHNNTLSSVIRGDLSGSKQETQQLKGTKTLPNRDHLLIWHQHYRHDPIQAWIYLLYRQEISHLSPSRSLHGVFSSAPVLEFKLRMLFLFLLISLLTCFLQEPE